MTWATCRADSLNNIETLKSYIQDVENECDQELVEFFDRVLENNHRAAQQAKETLVPPTAGRARVALRQTQR